MKRYQRFSAAGILLAAVMFSTSQQSAAQVLRIAEMNSQQIRALNLQKTVVLIPGGILEEHGPYLLSYTDGYADDAYGEALATATTDKNWTVRAAGLGAIAERGDRLLVPKITAAMDDDKELVRFMAAACIARLSDLPLKKVPEKTRKP